VGRLAGDELMIKRGRSVIDRRQIFSLPLQEHVKVGTSQLVFRSVPGTMYIQSLN